MAKEKKVKIEEVIEDEIKENEDKELIGTESVNETGDQATETVVVEETLELPVNPFAQLREKLGMTQKEFAEMLDITAKDVSEIENWKSKIGFVDLLSKLHQAGYKATLIKTRKAPLSGHAPINVAYATEPNKIIKSGTEKEIASWLSLTVDMVRALVTQNLPRGGMIFFRNDDEKDASLWNMLQINPKMVNYSDLNIKD